MKEFTVRISNSAGVFNLIADESAKEKIRENILKCILNEQVAFYSNEKGQHIMFPSELIRHSVITIFENNDSLDFF